MLNSVGDSPLLAVGGADARPAMLKVAVCLAAYNGVRWLPEQMHSILDQQGVAPTVFVSVDASSDGTEAWIDAYASRDKRIVVLPHGSRFGSAGRNFFRLLRDVNFSDFDYICFADQDDLWLQDKLERACTSIRENGADAYSSNVTAFWPDGRRLLIDKAQPQRKWDFLFEAAGPGCTYVLSSGLAQAVQARVRACWPDMQAVALHDWFVYAFARSQGFRWEIDASPGLLYRQHGNNEMGANAGWATIKRRLTKVLDGWWLGQAALIARLVGQDDAPVVRRGLHGGRLGLLWLAMQASSCRRRAMDRVAFFLFCAVLSVAGRHVGKGR